MAGTGTESTMEVHGSEKLLNERLAFGRLRERRMEFGRESPSGSSGKMQTVNA